MILMTLTTVTTLITFDPKIFQILEVHQKLQRTQYCNSLYNLVPFKSTNLISQYVLFPIGLRKGKTSRKAHSVSNVSTLRRPVIDTDSAGKVPVNIRQKYLDTIDDECLKIFTNNTAAAYQRAEKEERMCCEKSKTRSIYLNSVVMSIKKLRNDFSY